jgi:hypothetical protein
MAGKPILCKGAAATLFHRFKNKMTFDISRPNRDRLIINKADAIIRLVFELTCIYVKITE